MDDLIKQFYIKLTFKSLTYILAFALLFFGLGVLGLQIQSVQHGVTPFWPASGLTFAAFVIIGFWLWPGVFLGMCLLAIYIGIPIEIAIFSSVLSILESAVPIIIAHRYKFNGRLDSFHDGLIFTTIVVLAPVLTAVIGSLVMFLFSETKTLPAVDMMLVWWLGNSLGILLLGGALLSLNTRLQTKVMTYRINEKIAVLLATVLIFLVAFTQYSGLDAALAVNLLIPIIFIAVLRFGMCGAVTLSLIFVVLMSLFASHSHHSSVQELHFDFQFLILVKIWFVTISGVLIAGALKDKVVQGRLEWLAHHDGLTGLFNRVAMEDAIEFALKGFRRSDGEVCILFLDVDNFKPINDQLGHKKGDEILCHVAKVLTDSVRDLDVVSRWGGDEFIILLRQCSNVQALDIAKKILIGVESLSFVENSQKYPVSMSIGVSSAILGEPKLSFIERVDAACYAAKRNGRNQAAEG